LTHSPQVTRSIGFKLTTAVRRPEDSDESFQPYVDVNTKLLIDGSPAPRGDSFFFDLALVLSTGAEDADAVYPFTCSCGVPGCVSINEGGQISVDGEHVVWELPGDPFGGAFTAGLEPTLEPVRLVFQKVQYETALEEATCQLETISRETGLAVNIWPGSGGPPTGRDGQALPLREQLALDRQCRLDWDEDQRWRMQVWGDLLGHDLLVELPNGYIASIPVEMLGDALAGGEGTYQLDEEQLQNLEEHIAPTLHGGADNIIKAARSFSWPALSEYLFRDHTSRPGVDNVEYRTMKDWPAATLSVRTSRWS